MINPDGDQLDLGDVLAEPEDVAEQDALLDQVLAGGETARETALRRLREEPEDDQVAFGPRDLPRRRRPGPSWEEQ